VVEVVLESFGGLLLEEHVEIEAVLALEVVLAFEAVLASEDLL